MAITETRPEPTTVEPHVNPWGDGDEYPSFARSLGSSDHKTIGRLFIGFSLLFGVAAWVLVALSSLQDIKDVDIVPKDSVFQVFTLGRLSLVFLFALPLFLGLAIYLVPLQVGASTIAFPRTAAMSFWTWLLGAILLIVAYASNGGVGGGRANAVDLAYVALAAIVLALLLASVCVATTVVTLRAPGLRLDHVPMFSWAMLVASSMWLLSLPLLIANIVLIYIDHRLGRPSDFGVGLNQWPQVAWVVQQPQVFAFAIPVLGVVGDIVATMSGARQKNRGVMFAAIGAFGILSFGAWAQPFFNNEVTTQWLYIGMGFAILLPMLALLGGWATTMRSGKPRPTAATAAALLAMITLLLGGLANALYVIDPLKLQDTDVPYAQFGVLVLVIGAATVAASGALAYWAPKIWGRTTSNGLSLLAVLAGFLGAVIGGVALVVNGFQVRIDSLADASGFLNGVAVAGVALLALGVLLTVVSLLGRGPAAGNDPWDGQTLEWAATSPPPVGNFGELPPIATAEPLLDLREPVTEEVA
jgi:heme/copper-type cytochrome/quinol oxidase subunit 1